MRVKSLKSSVANARLGIVCSPIHRARMHKGLVKIYVSFCLIMEPLAFIYY